MEFVKTHLELEALERKTQFQAVYVLLVQHGAQQKTLLNILVNVN